MRTEHLRLCLVTDPILCRQRGLVETVLDAVAGGATSIQLRDKHASDQELIVQARALLQVLQPAKVPLVINDRVDVAREVGADGIHVGREDMPVEQVRQMVGPDMWIGFSVETAEAAERVDPRLVNYAGVGPVFSTGTKPDHLPPVGVEGLRRLAAVLPVPVVAIGGIGPKHGPELMTTGIEGVAVVSAICGTPDPKEATRLLSQSMEGTA